MTGDLTNTDFRRACSLLCHTGELHSAGASLALDEAGLSGPGARLALATAMLVFDIVPDLRSPEGLAALRELTRHYAEAEAAELAAAAQAAAEDEGTTP